MSTSEYEPTPSREVNPVRRFYSDLRFMADSRVDMIISAEKLIVSSGFYSEEEAVAMVNEYLYTNSPDHFSEDDWRDMYTVLPLELVGPSLEWSQDFKDVKAWYTQTANFIAALMSPRHNDTCVDALTFTEGMGCQHASFCPVVFTLKHLEASMFDSDFTTIEYVFQPLHTEQVAVMKENLAVDVKLRDRAQADRLIEAYLERFNESIKS